MKRGTEIKLQTQVVQIVYNPCALLIENLQVPYSVLDLIFMHRWSIILLFCLLENVQHYGHYCIYYFPMACRIKIKLASKDLLHPITISQTFSIKSHRIYLHSKCYSKYSVCVMPLNSKLDRKSTRLNSSHRSLSRMPSSA